MKKEKLKLEKFTISKLDNLHKIFGGDETDGTVNTQTEPLKCVKTSQEFVSR